MTIVCSAMHLFNSHYHVMGQVSVNTSAVAKHLRKAAKGGKRRIARTTLTSTALTSPTTMPSETPQSQPTASPGAATTPTSPAAVAVGVDADDAGDSSFETVAEALRLQWSVIGGCFLGFFVVVLFEILLSFEQKSV